MRSIFPDLQSPGRPLVPRRALRAAAVVVPLLWTAACGKEGPREVFRPLGSSTTETEEQPSARDDDEPTQTLAPGSRDAATSFDASVDTSDPTTSDHETPVSSLDASVADEPTPSDEPTEETSSATSPRGDSGAGSEDPVINPEPTVEAGVDEPTGGDDEPATDDTATSEPEPEPELQEEMTDECGAAPTTGGEFTRVRLREAAADCAEWHYCKFGAVADYLDAQTQAYADDSNEANLAAAQHAWRLAMQLWSRLELFQYGPMGSKSDTAGKDMYEGLGVRDLIYSWPSTSRCRVEEQLVNQNYAEHGIQSVLISGRGLYGLEYLLFYPEQDTACAANTATATGWSALDASELTARKADYAVAIAADIAAQIQRVSELWSPSGGNFRETFINATGMYPDEQEVLKVMAWSLVYAEREVKDWKLGIPGGYTLTHPVSGPESPFAQLGSDNIRANLEGFRSLFQGCGEGGEGLGFDDWLTEVGHAELAQAMIDALDGAQAVADDFPPLNEASAAEVEELYQAVRALTSLLKGEFFGAGSPLNLALPGGVASDTD